MVGYFSQMLKKKQNKINVCNTKMNKIKKINKVLKSAQNLSLARRVPDREAAKPLCLLLYFREHCKALSCYGLGDQQKGSDHDSCQGTLRDWLQDWTPSFSFYFYILPLFPSSAFHRFINSSYLRGSCSWRRWKEGKSLLVRNYLT